MPTDTDKLLKAVQRQLDEEREFREEMRAELRGLRAANGTTEDPNELLREGYEESDRRAADAPTRRQRNAARRDEGADEDA